MFHLRRYYFVLVLIFHAKCAGQPGDPTSRHFHRWRRDLSPIDPSLHLSSAPPTPDRAGSPPICNDMSPMALRSISPSPVDAALDGRSCNNSPSTQTLSPHNTSQPLFEKVSSTQWDRKCRGHLCKARATGPKKGTELCAMLYCIDDCASWQVLQKRGCKVKTHIKRAQELRQSTLTKTQVVPMTSGGAETAPNHAGQVVGRDAWYDSSKPLAPEHYDAQNRAEQAYATRSARVAEQRAAEESAKKNLSIVVWDKVRPMRNPAVPPGTTSLTPCNRRASRQSV